MQISSNLLSKKKSGKQNTGLCSNPVFVQSKSKFFGDYYKITQLYTFTQNAPGLKRLRATKQTRNVWGKVQKWFSSWTYCSDELIKPTRGESEDKSCLGPLEVCLVCKKKKKMLTKIQNKRKTGLTWSDSHHLTYPDLLLQHWSVSLQD